MNKVPQALIASLFSFLIFGHTNSLAQTKKEPTPEPPYLNAAPEYAAWTVTVSNFSIPKNLTPEEQAAASSGVTLKEEIVTKAKDILRYTCTYSNGKQSIGWASDGIRVTTTPHLTADKITIDRGPTLENNGAPVLTANPGQRDFPEMAWVDGSNFKGSEIYAGIRCNVHEAAVTWMQDRPTLMRVWIDAKTKLPLAMDDGSGTRVYSISAEAPATLSLPPLFAKKIAQYKRGNP